MKVCGNRRSGLDFAYNEDREISLRPIATVILGAPFLQGCVSSSKVEGPSASVGQQLQDLDKARKDGLINDKEYDRLRRAIIKKND